MIASVKKLINYRRGPRYASAESFPRWVEDELDKITTTTGNIIEVLRALEARIAALEPPKGP